MGVAAVSTGTRVTVTYGGIVATGIFISQWHDLRTVVRLDGTGQVVTVPRSWVSAL
jgi:hypothetical protein